MKNLKAVYIEKVLRMFANGRHSASTRARVERWLVNGEDSEAKDETLDMLWEESVADAALCDDPDCDADKAFARWQGRMAGLSAADNGASVTQSSPKPEETADRSHRMASRVLRFWQAVAACLVIAVGTLSWVTLNRRPLRSQMTQVYCSAGDTRQVTLPDGSVVTLNGGSTVTYPSSFDGYDRREVLLQGEAYFKVAKDRRHPFVVRGGEMDITALGTEFNVKAYPQTPTAHATLLEGSVKVETGTIEGGIILQPSEQVSFNRLTGEMERSMARTDDVTAWQRGEIVFNNLTLPEILSELSNRFSHDFVYNASALPRDRFTFRFRKGMTLDEVMNIVSDVAGNISVSIDADACKIRPKNRKNA